MKKLVIAGFAAALLAVAGRNPAQESPKPAGPVKEHEWLKQLLGNWDMESEMVMEPGQPPMKSKGTESVRAIGDFWIISEIKSDTPMGFPMSALMTLGFDPQKKKYVGTWVDSMMNHLWTYTGTVDATGKILTLESEGPNMMSPSTRM